MQIIYQHLSPSDCKVDIWQAPRKPNPSACCGRVGSHRW